MEGNSKTYLSPYFDKENRGQNRSFANQACSAIMTREISFDVLIL